jgi:hypothetical protein
VSDWGVIWLADIDPEQAEGAGVYHVDWYDDRAEALARRRSLIDSGAARAAWFVGCPLAIVVENQL